MSDEQQMKLLPKPMNMYFVFDKDLIYIGSSHNELVAKSISERIEGTSRVIEMICSPSNQRSDKSVENLVGALESILNNSCCNQCQEAALVARSALTEWKKGQV